MLPPPCSCHTYCAPLIPEHGFSHEALAFFTIPYALPCSTTAISKWERCGERCRPSSISSPPFLLLGGLFTIVVFHAEEILLPYKLQWECVVGGMSILLSIRMTRVGRWLIRKVDEYHTLNFSSDSDFPFAFAKKILYLPVMWLLVMWTQFLVDSQLLKAFIDLLLAAWQIRFLCRILHPNKLIHSAQGQEGMDTIAQDNMERVLKETEFFEQIVQSADNQTMEETNIKDIENADDELELQERNRENSRLQIKQENWESVKNEVLTIVSRRYLEPSLKRIEVVRDVSSMNHTLAGTFITQVGFYRLVNAFRIRHYERLMASDSSANIGQEAAAELCGFKNRWGLTNARKRLKDFDYDLIEKYVN